MSSAASDVYKRQADNTPRDLHFYDSVPVLVVCLGFFCFCFCFLDSVVDSCEFVAILMFIVLIFFFLYFI